MAEAQLGGNAGTGAVAQGVVAVGGDEHQPDPVAGLIAVLILFAVAIGLTIHLARKDRATLKVVRYVNRERLLSRHKSFPIQRFGGSNNVKKTD